MYKFELNERVYWVNSAFGVGEHIHGTIKSRYSEITDEGRFYLELYDIICDKGFVVTRFHPETIYKLN